mgnify:FL=1
MRKIAANYILLPGFEFVKNGYIVLKDGMVVDVVNTGGEIREIPCLEFYGGMLVDDRVRQHIVWSPGDPIREKILQLYRENGACGNSLALIQGVDFTRFSWMPESRIVYLR